MKKYPIFYEAPSGDGNSDTGGYYPNIDYTDKPF